MVSSLDHEHDAVRHKHTDTTQPSIQGNAMQRNGIMLLGSVAGGSLCCYARH